MNKKYGFTLIELLTVVVILGILTSIALPQYRKAIQRAEAANMLSSLKTVFDSAKRYYSSSGTWPSTLSGLDTTIQLNPGSTNQSGEYQFSFNTTYRSISVCKLNDSNACTYSFMAYYKHPNLDEERDVYTCNPGNSTKFQSLCESFGSRKDGTNTIVE